MEMNEIYNKEVFEKCFEMIGSLNEGEKSEITLALFERTLKERQEKINVLNSQIKQLEEINKVFIDKIKTI